MNRTAPHRSAAERPLLAESSHWFPSIMGVASVRYSPIPATQMLIFNLYREAAFDPKRAFDRNPIGGTFVIDVILECLNDFATRNENVPLGNLIGSIDAKNHAIPTAEELNEAIEMTSSFDVCRDKGEVILIVTDKPTRGSVTENDIKIAMSISDKAGRDATK
jgi:hypothetical protein